MVGFSDIWRGLGNAVGRVSGAGVGAYGGAIRFLDPNSNPMAPYSNPLTGAWHGAVEAPWSKPYSARQVFEDVGVSKPGDKREWWNAPLEFAVDIGTDPTSYAGGIGKGLAATGKLGKIGKIAESAGKFGTLGEDASRIERLAQSGRRFAHGTTLGAGDPAFGMLYAGVPKAYELAKGLVGKSAAVDKLLASKGAQTVEKAGTKLLGQKIPEELRPGDLDVISNVLRDTDLPVSRLLQPTAEAAAPVVARKAASEIPETLSERDLGLLDELWPTAPKTPKVKTKSGKPAHPAIEALMGGNKAVGKEQKAVVDAANEALTAPRGNIAELERIRSGGLIGEELPTQPNIADALAARDLPTAQRNTAIKAADEALLARRAPKAKAPKVPKSTRKNLGQVATPDEMEIFEREMRRRATSEALPEFLRSTPTPPTLAEIYERPEIKKLRGAAKNAAANKILRSFGQSG